MSKALLVAYASALHAPSINRQRCALRASPREVVDAFTQPSGAAATAVFCPRDTWAEDVTLRSACGVCVNGADALTRTADNWSRAAADELQELRKTKHDWIVQKPITLEGALR